MVPQTVSPQVRMLGKHFTHWERVHQVVSASICLFQILCSSTRHPSSLCFSRAFRHLEYAGSCQHFDMDETETGPCGYPPKNQNVGHTFHLFSSPWRSYKLRIFSHSFSTELRWGRLWQVRLRSLNICLCSQRIPRLKLPQCLDSGKTETCSSGNPLQSVDFGHVFQSFIPLSREKT